MRVTQTVLSALSLCVASTNAWNESPKCKNGYYDDRRLEISASDAEKQVASPDDTSQQAVVSMGKTMRGIKPNDRRQLADKNNFSDQVGVCVITYHWRVIPIRRNRRVTGRGGVT